MLTTFPASLHTTPLTHDASATGDLDPPTAGSFLPRELALTVSGKALPTPNSKRQDHFQTLNPNTSVTSGGSCPPAYSSCPILPTPVHFS